MLNYKHDIQLFITHPDDCIDSSTYEFQKTLFDRSIATINEYRDKQGFEPIVPHIHVGSNFNGYMESEDRRRLQHRIECCFKWEETYNKRSCNTIIDYFITTKQSTHQSHVECNKIALSVMRSPYIEMVKNILLATYPQDVYGISMSDSTLNEFILMDKEQVDLACYIIGSVYEVKNVKGTILGSDKFEEMLKYYGNVSNASDYAQPYLSLRSIRSFK